MKTLTALVTTSVLTLLAGSALADTASAVRAYDAGLLNVAAGELKREAEKGDTEAQYRLGVMYADGVWFPADRAEAIRWVGAAAVQGHPAALLRLEQIADAEASAKP